MKIKHTLLIVLAVAMFSGCKKDDPTPEPEVVVTTVAQDKENIHASLTELSGCVEEIRDAEGTKALTNFLNVSDGEALNEDWVITLLDSLADKLDFESIENSNKFDFNANAGTYTYNPTGKIYIKTSSPTDKIVVLFPSVPTSTTNNASLTVSGYADQAVLIDGTSYYLPTAFTASLVIDGSEIFKASGTIAYDAPIPINVNISVMLKPFTYSIKGNRVSPTKFNAALSVSNGSGCNTSASVDFEFTHSGYETMDLSTDLKTVTATVTHNNLKIVSNIDALSLNAIEDPTEEQINSFVKTNVYYNGAKVGELVTYVDSNDETQVRIIYKDGSMEDTKVYYEPFIEALENILEPLAGTDSEIL